MADISLELSQKIETVEAQTATDFYQCAPADYAEKIGIGVTQINSATALSIRKSTSLFFNCVLGLGLHKPVDEAQIDQIMQHYAACKIKRYSIAPSPLAQPKTLGDMLIQRGFKTGGQTAKMWRANEPPPEISTDLRVIEVGPAQATVWFKTMSAVFMNFRTRGAWIESRIGLQGWHHYLALDGDEPAATGVLFIRDGVGHLTDGVTLKAFRRRGAQSAIIHRRIVDGLKLGCKYFTVETAPPLPRQPLVSHRNLLRLGFEIAYLRTSYVFEKSNL